MCLYITTSKGLYDYDLKNNTLKKIIGNWHKGIFKKPSNGFFGICLDDHKKQIITVSREKLTKNSLYDKSTDLILHFYDPMSQLKLDEIIIYNLYDVHQIFYFNKKIYLTDTGKNRVQIYNCITKKIESFINVGIDRKNLNHVNAIFVDKNKILIGLNNGNKENFRNAQIIKINTNITYDLNFSIDACVKGKIIELNDIYHTHDLEHINNDFFVSASEDGNLVSLNKLASVKSLPKWARGISKSNNHIYVGKSGLASRKLRHSRYYDGMISVLDKETFNLIKELNIPKIGQLNDILYYEG